MIRFLIVASAAWYLHCHSVLEVSNNLSAVIKENQQPINEVAHEFRQEIVYQLSQNLHDFRNGLVADLQ